MGDRAVKWRQRSVCWAGVLWVLTSITLQPGAAQDTPPQPTPTAPAENVTDLEPDLGYQQVLAAYRGQLSPEELATLTEIDPTPALYLTPNTPSERAITLLFASLPDSVHKELQEKGYLKWRINALPERQREWVKRGAQRLEALGEGPFPVDGPNASTIGFARVEVPGQIDPHYCWWITSSYARPSWITLVRAFGVVTAEASAAYRKQLEEITNKTNTPRIPDSDWIKVSEPKPIKRRAEEMRLPALIDEKFYQQVVAAYAVKLKGDKLRKLLQQDPLIEKRLLSAKPMDRGARRLLASLSKEQHETLITTGQLILTPSALDREQRDLLRPAIEELNAKAAASGTSPIPHTLDADGVSLTGFALVRVPGLETPSLCWWLRSLFNPDVVWVTLTNQEAVSDPAYYDAHLAQIPRP